MRLFINDDGSFTRLYGSISGLFNKIYAHTQDYNQLKQAVPDNKLDTRLIFAQFLEEKGRGSEAYLEYKSILDQHPDNIKAKEGLDRLKRE